MCQNGCNNQGGCRALTFLHGSPDLNNIDANKSYLMKLPSELHLKIFGYLGPARSTSFGLTCKHLYGIHKTLHPERIELSTLEGVGIWSKPLHLLLRSWVGPGYVYSLGYGNKFLPIAVPADARPAERREQDQFFRKWYLGLRRVQTKVFASYERTKMKMNEIWIFCNEKEMGVEIQSLDEENKDDEV